VQEHGAKKLLKAAESMLRKFIFNQGLVTDGCLSTDPTNEEIIQAVYKKSIREGEERLMAVLESAVEDFQKYVLAQHASGKKLFQHAKEWFLEKDSGTLFSFESICETLQLHPDYIRQGLLLRKEAKLKTSCADDQRAGHSKLAKSRVTRRAVRFSKTA
jgi:hypothetical protein